MKWCYDTESTNMQELKIITRDEGERGPEIKREPAEPEKSESLSDRDAGFCSGEETDLDAESPSPTDEIHHAANADTKDFIFRNKRKSDQLPDDDHVPEMKMIKLEQCSDRASPCSVASNDSSTSFVKVEKSFNPTSPFRPWKSTPDRAYNGEFPSLSPPQPHSLAEYGFVIQDEPLALVVEKEIDFAVPATSAFPLPLPSPPPGWNEEVLDLSRPVDLRPQEVVRIASLAEEGDIIPKSTSVSREELRRYRCGTSTSVSDAQEARSSQSGAGSSSSGGRGTASILSSHQQRNYKNMSRERRIEANARERSRVHTISAAFDTLRQSIPAYASNQKLSKLSVLRVACSYIQMLSRMSGQDYSADQSAPSLADCVENVNNTIQLEGKTRKKKEDGES